MTEIVYTHSFDTEYTSSVIDEVCYSEPHKLLFVSLVNGTLAGYDGVPLEVYNALSGLNTNRLSGDTNASVGRYWNTFVKNHFDGFSTSDVELISSEDVAPQESFSFFNDPSNVTVGEIVTEDEQPKELSQFGVIIPNGDEDANIIISAADVEDAVDRFQRAAAILGWDDLVIIGVTQFFD